MQIGKCVYKERDEKTNQIVNYVITDTKGILHDFSAEGLKRNIREKQLDIVNLTLTNDNRLVETKVNKEFKFNLEEVETNVYHYLAKMSLMKKGSVNKITNVEGKNIYLFKRKCMQSIVYIPNDVSIVCDQPCFNYLFGALFVYGGRGLKTTQRLFENYSGALDLTFLNTDNVINMTGMFNGCKTSVLDLSSLNTQNVMIMNSMFFNCGASKINLSSFNTAHTKFMTSMFNCSAIKRLNLTIFDWTMLEIANSMFARSKIEYLDLTNFPMITENNKHMIDGMFYSCSKLKRLRIKKENELLFENAITHINPTFIERV